MAKGQDESDRDDGKVLAPDELDISDDEHVAEIEEGRYVVSPNDPIDDVDETTVSTASSSSSRDRGQPEPEPEPETEREPERDEQPTDPFSAEQAGDSPAPEQPELSKQQVHDWLKDEFADVPSRYGFDVTAKFDGPVQQRQMMSNDVVTIFESLILWYAQHIDTDTPVEEVLGILLMESNVPIRYPPETLQRLVKSSGLGPDDTIADLMDAIGDDGMQL